MALSQSVAATCCALPEGITSCGGESGAEIAVASTSDAVMSGNDGADAYAWSAESSDASRCLRIETAEERRIVCGFMHSPDQGAKLIELVRAPLLAHRGVGPESEADSVHFNERRVTKVGPEVKYAAAGGLGPLNKERRTRALPSRRTTGSESFRPAGRCRNARTPLLPEPTGCAR